MDMKTVGGWNAYHWLSGEQYLVAMDTECIQSPFNYFIITSSKLIDWLNYSLVLTIYRVWVD